MEKNPYKFDEKNSRLVISGADRSGLVWLGAGAFFTGSLFLYSRRFFRVDHNALNLAVFALASVPASYSYSSFLFSSAEVEAGIKNNEHEGK